MDTNEGNLKYLRRVRWAEAFQGLGDNIAGIFVPLFLITIGFDFSQVMLYLFLYCSVMLFNNASTYWVNKRLGTRYGLFLGYLSQVIFFIILAVGQQGTGTIILLSIFSGMVDGLLWSTRHFVVATRTLDKTHSRQISYFLIVQNLARIIALILAIGIAKFSSPQILIWLAVAVTFLASLITLTLDNDRVKEKFEFSTVKEIVGLRDGFSNVGLNVCGFGFSMAFAVFVAFKLSQIPKVAAIAIVVSCVAMIISKITGKMGDRGKNKSLILLSTVLASLLGPFIFLASSTWSILVISIFINLLITLIMVPWVSLYYSKVKKSHRPYSAVMALEIWGDTGRATFAMLAWILSLRFSFDTTFFIIFSLAGISSLLMNLMDDHLLK